MDHETKRVGVVFSVLGWALAATALGYTIVSGLGDSKGHVAGVAQVNPAAENGQAQDGATSANTGQRAGPLGSVRSLGDVESLRNFGSPAGSVRSLGDVESLRNFGSSAGSVRTGSTATELDTERLGGGNYPVVVFGGQGVATSAEPDKTTASDREGMALDPDETGVPAGSTVVDDRGRAETETDRQGPMTWVPDSGDDVTVSIMADFHGDVHADIYFRDLRRSQTVTPTPVSEPAGRGGSSPVFAAVPMNTLLIPPVLAFTGSQPYVGTRLAPRYIGSNEQRDEPRPIRLFIVVVPPAMPNPDEPPQGTVEWMEMTVDLPVSLVQTTLERELPQPFEFDSANLDTLFASLMDGNLGPNVDLVGGIPTQPPDRAGSVGGAVSMVDGPGFPGRQSFLEPEPSTALVWMVAMAVGLCYCARVRRIRK